VVVGFANGKSLRLPYTATANKGIWSKLSLYWENRIDKSKGRSGTAMPSHQ